MHFNSFLHWQSAILLWIAINHHYNVGVFSHRICSMILFSFLFLHIMRPWLISSYPFVGGISGQINIFAVFIVSTFQSVFFVAVAVDRIQIAVSHCIASISLTNSFFFLLIIIFYCFFLLFCLSEKAHGTQANAYLFLQYVHFHSVSLILIFKYCSFSGSVYVHCYLCEMHSSETTMRFWFYHCLSAIKASYSVYFWKQLHAHMWRRNND